MSFTDRFTERADAYVAGRPSYPPAAIDAIFAGLGHPATLAVADIGAGTGISSRIIADRASKVFAIEPNAAMRGAAQRDPRIEWIDGTAERTTLADRSVDIVAAFQAWHWFDHALATAEARRILRPGGKLAVVYNERDEHDPFTAGYGEIVRRYATDATEKRREDALAHALGLAPDRTTREEFQQVQTLDRGGVHQRAKSSSYLPQDGPAADAMHAEIDALFERFTAGGSAEMHLTSIVACVEMGVR